MKIKIYKNINISSPQLLPANLFIRYDLPVRYCPAMQTIWSGLFKPLTSSNVSMLTCNWSFFVSIKTIGASNKFNGPVI